MERLEKKKIYGQTYYYYSKWAWVNGKCRRVWQRYLGKLENIVKAVAGVGQAPLYAEVFQWGLPTALWKECRMAGVVDEIDKLCPKRDQGVSTGEYIAIAAVNRALASQRFWDHMDRIGSDTALLIWKRILKGVANREKIDLSSLCYDGTNFYTFIDTFNTRCEIAKRGKNKQGRHNLRQINYALFCCSDGHMPLFYDVYEGSRNDSKQFSLIMDKFYSFLNDLTGLSPAIQSKSEITLVFDKGNNSKENFMMLDSLQLNFVGSVKLSEHKDLATVSNNDYVFIPCSEDKLEGTKSFRVTKNIHGRKRTLIVSYNQNLFNAQWLTLQNDISNAVEKLSLLQQKLEDRANSINKRGKIPTKESVEKQCKKILKRQYMKSIIKVTVSKGSDTIPQLTYEIDSEAVHKLADTYLGKNIIITSRENWDNEKIILTYRSQFIIEDVFKEMKDRKKGSWWPLHHWTDSKIKVHALYCSIALLLKALMVRRVWNAGLHISSNRIIAELETIREVINIFPRKRGQKIERKQTVLTKTSEIQKNLMAILKLDGAVKSPTPY